MTRKLKQSPPPELRTGDQASAEEVIDHVLHLLAQAVVADVMEQPNTAENTMSASGADEEGD